MYSPDKNIKVQFDDLGSLKKHPLLCFALVIFDEKKYFANVVVSQVERLTS